MSLWVKVPVPGPEEAYYWNPDTQATSWKAPEGVDVLWVAQKTTSGKREMYFWNRKTRETTWELPVRGPSASSSTAASSTATPFPAQQSASSGRPPGGGWCFGPYSQFSGSDCDAGSSVPENRPPFREPLDVHPRGGDWIEVAGHAESPSRTFFMNFKQGLSSWNLPPGEMVAYSAYQHASGAWYYVHVASGNPVWRVADMLAERPLEDCGESPSARWIEIGAGMMAVGLSSRNSRYNQQVGKVLGYGQDGRVHFQLPNCQGGTILRLRPRNVEPLVLGSIVEITGLTSNQALNGITGTVVGHDHEKCRYTVRLQTGTETTEKAIRATKVLARSRLWDLDPSQAPSWLRWRQEQDCLFVDSGGFHRRFSLHLPLRFAMTARESGGALVRWPLMVYMHGAGGSSFFRHSKKSLQSAGLNHCAENFVVVSPHCDWNWKDRPKPWITELVVALRASEWIEHRRVYLTGCSMGGMGTWEVGAEHPELFAAVAPVAAHHSDDRTEHIARRLRCTPVFVVHSLHDGVCPHSKEMPLWTRLKEEGNQNLKVCLANHVDHTYMYDRSYCDDSTIYTWLLRWKNQVE